MYSHWFLASRKSDPGKMRCLDRGCLAMAEQRLIVHGRVRHSLQVLDNRITGAFHQLDVLQHGLGIACLFFLERSDTHLVHFYVWRLNFTVTSEAAETILAFPFVIPLAETAAGMRSHLAGLQVDQAEQAHVNSELENEVIDLGQFNEALQGAACDHFFHFSRQAHQPLHIFRSPAAALAEIVGCARQDVHGILGG